MAETIETRCSVPKWHWDNVMRDLEEQAGLKGVIIDPLGAFGGSRYGDVRFNVTWTHNEYLLITMTKYSQELIDAFSKVVGYQPFCRYIHALHGLPTIEWDKLNPNERFAELTKDSAVSELVRLTEAQ